MIHIRPHKLLDLYETKTYGDRMVNVVLPNNHTPLLIETSLLLALTKLIKPSVFLEIGTFMGIQTLNIAANLPATSKVYTLDFDRHSFAGASQDKNDAPLSRKHFDYEDNLAFMGTEFEDKIECLYGDSKTFDFSRFEKSVDVIYVDGGHDLLTLSSDTENAFRLLPDGGLSCIAWHDYGSPNYPQVTEFLDKLSEKHGIYHVEGTKLVFHLKNISKELESKLTASDST